MAKFLGKDFRQKVSDKKLNRKTQTPGDISGSGTGYFYLTGLVREFIGEPDVYLKAREHNLLKVSNHSDYEIMTKNSLIAYIIDDAESSNDKPPVICYPFFPHLSLPIKPGEHVWLLKDEFFGRDMYYWLSRKTGVKQTEDINYTHAERFAFIDEKLIKNDVSNSTQSSGNLFEHDSATSELKDGNYIAYDNPDYSHLPAGINNNVIVSDSFTYRQEFTAEPVPPVRRKCGDALLLGSNNAMVHLTTEKFKPNELDKKEFTGQASSTKEPIPGRRPLSPAIDLCVGRKKEELTLLKNNQDDTGQSGSIKITKAFRGGVYSELESYEIDKLGDILGKSTRSAGKLADSSFDHTLSIDTIATNCGARLYLSNNCAIDETFGSSFSGLSSLGGSSLVTYADHNRMIADNSLRLTNRIGQSFIDMNTEGKVRIQGKTKIELAVRSNDTSPAEPYVLYTTLAEILTSLQAQITALAAGVSASSALLLLPTGAEAMVAPSNPANVTAIGTITTAATTAATTVATAAPTNATKIVTMASLKIFGE